MAEFPDIAADYNRYVTADQRSPKRNLDGFQNYPEILNMIDRLLARGYSEDDVRRFLGENYLRLFKQVWGA
jgi:membrane dipeptidase